MGHPKNSTLWRAPPHRSLADEGASGRLTRGTSGKGGRERPVPATPSAVARSVPSSRERDTERRGATTERVKARHVRPGRCRA